jgi:hypothetical protein
MSDKLQPIADRDRLTIRSGGLVRPNIPGTVWRGVALACRGNQEG